MNKTTLEQWWVDGDSFDAPEIRRVYLSGEVYNHPDNDRFPDGKKITTSRIVKTEGRKITTRSGTIYYLGEVEAEYKKFLEDINYDFDPENPIKLIRK